MPISKPQTSSPDIKLPVLTSHALSIQPPLEQVPLSSRPISEANSIAKVDEVEPPTPGPAYSPPSNDIPPIQSFDNGLLEYKQLHGHSEIPLYSRQREDDRNLVHPSEASALPAYRADTPPRYSQRHGRRDLVEPMTWPAISFRIGFLFPLFWLFGALTLITPRGSLDRIFMFWFKDFAPSTDSWLDTLETETEKEKYLARVRAAERKWGLWCFFAFQTLLIVIGVAAATAVSYSRVQ